MRIISSFIGFVLAIIITIFIFAPDRLPVGYGFEPIPVDLTVQNTLAGELVETMTGKSAKNLVIKNTSDKVIYNLTLTLRDKDGNIKHQFIEPRLPVAGKVSLGWAQDWSFEPGDELEAAASTYYKVIWAL
jgi:hypothetical protein